jgi:16S rRNA (uracil1498-N3)-methyltransferase
MLPPVPVMNPRFLAHGIRESGQLVQLEGDEFHHLCRVLRLKVDDEISLFDGAGRGFAAKIVGLTRDAAQVLLGPEEPAYLESALPLTLLAALSKGEKLEWIVQKATELGVREIRPVYTERSDVRPVRGRGDGKTLRWRRVALEACKQSGRMRLPVIHDPQDLGEVMATGEGVRGFMLDPEAPAGGWHLVAADPGASLVAAVGPEGGWSPREREGFREAGFIPLSLGPRILRTETAAVVAAALFQFIAGDLSGVSGEGSPRGR